ncbi:hypothetical protein BD414DRAFT_496830 [Trametes punicea]|nr:hypothetical protein BD414DRAFT_496830 [Trametes punicea]
MVCACFPTLVYPSDANRLVLRAADRLGASSEPLDCLGPVSTDCTALLTNLTHAVDEIRWNQQAALEQTQRENAQRAALLQQQRVLTAATLRRELRTYNSMSSCWKPLPLPNGDPFPEGAPFPRNVRALKQDMPCEDVCRLAQLYDIDVDDGDRRLRDHLAIFLAGLRA